MQTQDDDCLIGVPEICAILDCGKSTVYELFNVGKLTKIKLGRSTKAHKRQAKGLVKAGLESGRV